MNLYYILSIKIKDYKRDGSGKSKGIPDKDCIPEINCLFCF